MSFNRYGSRERGRTLRVEQSTETTASAVYLFFGLHGYNALVPWMRTAIAMNPTAVLMLTIDPPGRKAGLLGIARAGDRGVWIEKGMGLIVPGFVPTPVGEVFEYTPTATEMTEVFVSLGIRAFGAIVFTLLAKIAIPIEEGHMRLRTAHLTADHTLAVTGRAHACGAMPLQPRGRRPLHIVFRITP